jgi:hypothetical protein
MYIQCDQIKKNEMGGVCGMYGGETATYMRLVGKPEGKIPLRRLKCKWEDSIKVNLQEIGWRGVEWIDLAQDMDS